MLTRKRTGKSKILQSVETYADLISVAKNRSLEPYIKSFVAAPENITQESLGELVGVFSVSDHSESSAYIVNMLASIAKKEYFANPRRGAIESFESALHRMNVALTELVKNDQTNWIGSIHGAIAVVEKGNIHFSVTGEGRIFLFRNGSLLDISEGLASEDAAIHPLKTFVEISSGRLAPDDCALLVSPELFELFSESELERNARRLVPEGKFSRFLETAIINELRIGGAVIIHAEEKTSEATVVMRRQKRKEQETLENVFSAETFRKASKKKAEEVSRVLELPESPKLHERKPDTPTRPFGEIYIQGESTSNIKENPLITKIRWIGEDTARAARNARAKLADSIRKTISESGNTTRSTVSSGLARTGNAIKRAIQKPSFPKRTTEIEATTSPEAPKEELGPPRRKMLESIRSIRFPKPSLPNIPKVKFPSLPSTSSQKERFASFGRDAASVAREALVRFRQACGTTFRKTGDATGPPLRKARATTARLWKTFLELPPKRQLLIAAGSAFVVTLVVIGIRNHFSAKEPTTTIVVTETPAPEPFPPIEEQNAVLASPKETYDVSGALLPLYLDGKLFVVTESGITDPSSGKSSAAPGRIESASAMNDLDAIFVFTESRELFIFYPVNGRFLKNDIPLPSNLAIHDLGSFLTYTYLLDTKNKQVLRFPRAEGGFGEGKDWLASPAPLDTITGGAVSESIYLYSATDVLSFFRGKPTTGFTFEKPATPLTVTALCATPDTPDTFVILDAPAKRLIVYATTGEIRQQLFDEELFSATTCALSPDATSIAVSAGDQTLVFSR